MSYVPDLDKECMVAEREHVRAVGWLHPDYPIALGEVSGEFVEKLKAIKAQSCASADALYFGAFGGLHTCEFCGREHGSANFGVPAGELLYVAPEMIVHYIEQHGYCPPPEFVLAVLRSPLPESDEYRILTEPFWHLHNAMVQQVIEATTES